MMKDSIFLEGIKNEIAQNNLLCKCINFTPNPTDVLDPECPFETRSWRMEMWGCLGEYIKDGVKYSLMNCLWMPKNFHKPLHILRSWHLTLMYQEDGKQKYQNF